MHKSSTSLLLRPCYDRAKGLTAVTVGPILIYRKEDREQESTGFVDNSIALISCGKADAGLRTAPFLTGARGRTPSPRPLLGSNRFPSPLETTSRGVISISLTLLRSQPSWPWRHGREGLFSLRPRSCSCRINRAVSCTGGLTCCKARRRPLDLSSVSCTGQGLKSSQIGLQRVSGVSEAGR